MEQPLQPTGQAQNVSTKKAWYKKWWVIGIGVLILYSIGSSGLDDAKKKADDAKSKVAQEQTPTVTTNTAAVVQKEEVKSKTDQQILEEKLTNLVTSIGGKDMSFRGLDIEKSDPDRPKDTKMVTVKVDVKSFFTKNSLLHDTGKLSSSMFQEVYNVSSINPYDVFVWYYGETVDQYGNKKNDAILTYHIDKATYGKINWENFDRQNFCNFLEQEAKTTNTFDMGCKVLANIK